MYVYVMYIHIHHEIFSHKKNEILIHAENWMNLKNIMPEKTGQTQKGSYCMISLIWGTENQAVHRDRKRNRGYQGLGEGRREELLVQSLIGTEFLLEMMKKFGCM